MSVCSTSKSDPIHEYLCPDADDTAAIHFSDSFPIQIKEAPGRGRGFFATRDIAPGEVVFRAVPVAWTISESWVKNTCWWCFAYDFRRPFPIKAVNYVASSRVAPGSKQLPHTRYKGVFCSHACLQSAERAYGGHEHWENYLMLLNFIEADFISQKTRSARKPNVPSKHRVYAYTSAATTCTTDCVLHLASPDLQLATFTANLDTKPLADDAFVASEFELGTATDEQLASWIATVWDKIAIHQIFSANMPDRDQRELVRLVASVLFLNTNGTFQQEPWQVGTGADKPCKQLQQLIVASAESEKPGVAPLQALGFVKSNEVECVREALELLHSTDTVTGSSPLDTPATLISARLPYHPTCLEIENSWWGSAFKIAAASYALLHRAWSQAANSHQFKDLTHEQFRW
ncbi:hypothetical protein H4S08_004187, partial [Coemansia sp. RSA 1365]